MIELEILVEVYDTFENALKKIEAYDFIGEKHTVDKYYYDPLRSELNVHSDGKLYASFRVRRKGKENFVTYKNDYYREGVWQYSDEYETKVDDFDMIEKIIANLGLRQLVIIDSRKFIFSNVHYEIVLEKVDRLGVFLEVELREKIEESEVDEWRTNIQMFIDQLGLSVSKELNCGKPELMISRGGEIR